MKHYLSQCLQGGDSPASEELGENKKLYLKMPECAARLLQLGEKFCE